MNNYTKTCILISLLFLSPVSRAEIGVSKDWVWSTNEGIFYFAMTRNSNNHTLGQYCNIDDAACFYMVALDITCESGSTYPALINSDIGAFHVLLKCAHEHEGQNILAVNEFDKIDGLVKKASHIGFVIPMADEQFKVVRFSLMGSAEAISQMRVAAKRAVDALDTPKKTILPDEEFM